MADSIHDLLIVGGGINGAGIARDAAGRGLSVLLVEQDDLASHTSSASTKLVHGGLRYLEYYEFRLVRESLVERERLLRLAPHIIWPLRFVMPMPPGGRPAWLIRMGLFLYDHIGGRRTLPGSRGVSRGDGVFEGLGNQVTRGFEYSDCWVDDARLVVLNAVGARELGAEILTRTKLTAARREGDLWVATILDRRSGAERTVRARAVVNAAGPWVGKVLEVSGGVGQARAPRLVKGSHIIVPRRLPGDHAFILQNPDKRIVFAIPYEDSFTLIGTTDVSFTGDPSAPEIAPDEVDYLCESANHYLAEPIAPSDVVRSYSGVRPLYDDGREDASKVTRDYVLEVDAKGGAPLLSVFGGKITTYRRLAEHALTKLTPYLKMKPAWTAHAPLPGGDKGFAAFSSSAWNRWSFISKTTLRRQLRSLGNRLAPMLGDATSLADLGEDFGGGLTACEVDYYVREEWARTAEDILWRRTKIGLHTGPETAQKLRAYLGEDR